MTVMVIRGASEERRIQMHPPDLVVHGQAWCMGSHFSTLLPHSVLWLSMVSSKLDRVYEVTNDTDIYVLLNIAWYNTFKKLPSCCFRVPLSPFLPGISLSLIVFWCIRINLS